MSPARDLSLEVSASRFTGDVGRERQAAIVMAGPGGRQIPIPRAGALLTAQAERRMSAEAFVYVAGVPMVFSSRASVPRVRCPAAMGNSPRWFQRYRGMAHYTSASVFQESMRTSPAPAGLRPPLSTSTHEHCP